jgi:hypothetical protein
MTWASSRAPFRASVGSSVGRRATRNIRDATYPLYVVCMSGERSCEESVARRSRRLVGLPQPHECPDGPRLSAETLPPRDVEGSGDLLCGPLLHVPQEQEVPVAIGKMLHPSADLRAFVERLDQTLTEPFVVLGTRCPNLEDGRRVGLPPIRVRDQTANNALGSAESRSRGRHRWHQTKHYGFTE